MSVAGIAAEVPLYTEAYIAPALHAKANAPSVSLFLLTLGIAAIAGLLVTGLRIDQHMRVIAFVAMMCFVVGMGVIATASQTVVILIGAAIWGIGLGASPTVYQTACARLAGPQVDQAQSLLVTIFNAGMAGGSALGGAVLAVAGSPRDLPWLAAAVFVLIIAVLAASRRDSLPGAAADFTAAQEAQP